MKGDKGLPPFHFQCVDGLALSGLHLCRARFHPHINITNVTIMLLLFYTTYTFAGCRLEDGVNIITLQKMMGPANIESTMVYLHVCQTPDQLPNSPLDKVFALCRQRAK